MSNALKFLLLAAGCGLVILLITIAVLTARKGNDDIESNVSQYSENASEYEDVDLKVYDGTTILGSEVKRLIETYCENDEEYLSIVIDTNRGITTSYVNTCTLEGIPEIATNSGADYTGIPSSKSDIDYVNDAGEFLCSLYYDVNDVVACLWFAQQ